MVSRLKAFLRELRRRKVYHVAVVYGVVGFGVASGAQYVFEMLGFPVAVAQLVAILIILGFPVSLVLAWASDVRPTEPRDLPATPDPTMGPSDAEANKSIVVLPFENLSPDPENAFFADGLTEEIIADLSQLRSLRVISRTSAFSLKGCRKNAPTIARDLNVRFVLEGSVRRAGSGLRITAQLIDALADTHLWAEKYSGTLDDVFDLEEQLSRRIIEGMKVSLTDQEDRQLSERPIPHVGAYEHYLRARPNIYAFDAPSIDLALRNLEAGLEILGENVHLLKGLGMALFQKMNTGLTEDPEVVQEVEACAGRIRALAPDDAASFMVSGLAHVLRADFPGAVHQLREAYRRDPSDPDTMLWLGVHSLSTGQMDAAEKLINTLRGIDPLAPLSALLVSYLAYFQGRFGEAAALQEESLRLGPEVLVSLWCAVRTFMAADHPHRAVACAKALRDKGPQTPFSEAADLFVMGMDAGTQPMPEANRTLRTWATRDGEWAQYLSDAYAFGGDQERALEWLDLAREAGFLNHRYLAHHDPFLRPLAGSPEWVAALDRVRESHREFELTLAPITL